MVQLSKPCYSMEHEIDVWKWISGDGHQVLGRPGPPRALKLEIWFSGVGSECADGRLGLLWKSKYDDIRNDIEVKMDKTACWMSDDRTSGEMGVEPGPKAKMDNTACWMSDDRTSGDIGVEPGPKADTDNQHFSKFN
jgi:hypothetical protein